MTCDRIWRKCFFKHIDIPKRWRTDDADAIKPSVQDVFWIECSVPEVRKVIIPLIRDEVHKALVEEAVHQADEHKKGFGFIATRWGTYVQYYPFICFNAPGSAWEHIGPVNFNSFDEFEKVYPRSYEVTQAASSKLRLSVPMRTYKVSPKNAKLNFDCLP